MKTLILDGSLPGEDTGFHIGELVIKELTSRQVILVEAYFFAGPGTRGFVISRMTIAWWQRPWRIAITWSF
jgi:hypothetical protein